MESNDPGLLKHLWSAEGGYRRWSGRLDSSLADFRFFVKSAEGVVREGDFSPERVGQLGLWVTQVHKQHVRCEGLLRDVASSQRAFLNDVYAVLGLTEVDWDLE